MYYKTICKAGKTIEVYRSYSKRTKKAKETGNRILTKEEIEANNLRRAVVSLTRKLNANFDEKSCHLIFTYRTEERPTLEESVKRIRNLLRNLGREYKKEGGELKYILVTEYHRGKVHHHVVVNGMPSGRTLETANSKWKYGYIKCSMLDDTGQYRKLAEYLIKETQKSYKEGKIGKQRYTSSRNLIIPKSKTKTVKADRWLPEPRIPKGYYLDKDTLYNGTDPFTGRLVQKYTLIELRIERGVKYGN